MINGLTTCKTLFVIRLISRNTISIEDILYTDMFSKVQISHFKLKITEPYILLL